MKSRIAYAIQYERCSALLYLLKTSAHFLRGTNAAFSHIQQLLVVHIYCCNANNVLNTLLHGIPRI